ncbi:hypothetical protein BC938DRAFT_478736, partial [Jimgerdemannia flammicorona]
MKKRFDPALWGVKPDFIIRTAHDQKHIELLVGEVKPPNAKIGLVKQDLVSLGKVMKNAIDKSIEDGIPNLVICGLHIVGFLGRAYVMDLQFDGVYRMIMIGEFEFPQGATSLGTILGCYQVLRTIQ